MTDRLDVLFNIAHNTPVSIVLPNGSKTYACHEVQLDLYFSIAR